MVIIRFGLLFIIGLFFIFFANRLKKRRLKILEDESFTRTTGIVKNIELVLDNVPERMRSYHVNVEFTTNNKEKVSVLSCNSIHSRSDYNIGDSIEIVYKKENYNTMYLVDDKKNAEITEKIFLSFGAFLCILSIILMFIYK